MAITKINTQDLKPSTVDGEFLGTVGDKVLWQTLSNSVPALNFGETNEKWTGRRDYTVESRIDPITGQQEYPKIYHRWFSWGFLPSAQAITKPHGVPSISTMVTVDGVARIPGSFTISLPFGAPGTTLPISITADSTNIILTTGNNRTTYVGWIRLEYTCTDR